MLPDSWLARPHPTDPLGVGCTYSTAEPRSPEGGVRHRERGLLLTDAYSAACTGASDSGRQDVGSPADSVGIGCTTNTIKCPFAGEKLEAATGVEPVMEVLQTSVGGAQGWRGRRHCAAPSNFLGGACAESFSDVMVCDEASRRHPGGGGNQASHQSARVTVHQGVTAGGLRGGFDLAWTQGRTERLSHLALHRPS